MRGSKEQLTARERRRGEGGGSGACNGTEKRTAQQAANREEEACTRHVVPEQQNTKINAYKRITQRSACMRPCEWVGQ